ncbi:MAG: hypothetical protein JXR25_11520 [Pontiellaceae bacterium]|nr:hypothetical protein [Pontiellaceae bacterium]MBN2785443.1 hypothetical protein [Pontiellaceae bacterium]
MISPRHVYRILNATFLIVLLSGAFPAPPACAQLAAPEGVIETIHPYIIKTWRISDGLPYNQINDILQRRNGYIWLATPNGAARFDGVSFEHFNMRAVPALPNNLITTLFEDQSGNLMLGHGSGHITIHTDNVFYTLDCPVQWMGTAVTGFTEMDNGSVWAINSKGQHLQVSRAGKIMITPEICAPPDRLFEGWDVHDERIVYIQNEEITADLGPTPWSIKKQQVRLLERKNGDLAVGTVHGGVFILHQTGDITRIRLLEGLASSRILCLMEDAEETLWIGTPVGLQSIRFQCPSFSGIHANWPFTVFRSVTPRAKGGVWLGANKGLIYRFDNNELTMEPGFDYLERVFRTLIEDQNGMLWANDDFGFLLRHNEVTGANSKIWPQTIAIDKIQVLHAAPDGTLWGGGENGLWQKTDEGWTNILGPERGISDIHCLVSSKDNSLWIGMKNGRLVRWHNGRRYFYGEESGLSSADISVLFMDQTISNRLWVGTSGKGLFYLEDGMAKEVLIDQNMISGILQDQLGRLWVMGEQGLSAFKTDALQSGNTPESIILLDANDGIGTGMDIREVSSSVCETADHKFWIISDQQVVSFDPVEIKEQTKQVPLLLTTAIVNGEPHSLEGLNHVTLNPGVNRLDIRYAGLNFVSASRIRFRCRMVGLSDEWIDLGSRRIASYQHLPPGRYRFELTASNRDGIWNRNPVYINILVEPHYWEAWWFKTSGYLVASGILILISLATADRMNRRRLILMEKSKAVEQERTRIAMDLHDEIGSELTRLQLLCHRAEMAIKKLGISDTPQSIFEIRRVTNKLVAALDEMVWVVRPTNDNLEHVIGYLTQYASSFFENSAITCKTDMPLQLPDADIPGPVRHNLYLALKEALNNIVKHAEATEVLLEVNIEEQLLILSVHDNGKGIDSREGERFKRGLVSMRRRMQLNGGIFSIRINEKQGTTVRFEQPLKEGNT